MLNLFPLGFGIFLEQLVQLEIRAIYKCCMLNIKTKKILFVILFLLTFILGFFVGTASSIKELVRGEDGNVEIAKVIDLYAKTRSEEISFDQFWKVWDLIKRRHFNQPVDEVDLFYGAISGLVEGLDDPYSVYMPPAQAEEFAKDLSGEFEGIGAEIGIRQDQLIIIAPLPGSPAEQSGLKPGDKIFAIDGEDTFNLSLDEAVLKIRGPKGTTVVLTISHDSFESVEEISVIRDVINVPTILWEMKENNIAYLRISYFNETTWKEFDKAVKEILQNNPDGIILDLRSNPGGFLETSVYVASEWVESGIIASEKYSDGRKKEYKSSGKHRFVEYPTVVLVDEGSASGSEIVAGALQDYQVATLVGAQTYGKGSVQDLDIFSDGSALKLTIAKWFTPFDRQIDEEGIMPDVIVEEMFVSTEDDNGEVVDVVDRGLEKAIEILTKN